MGEVGAFQRQQESSYLDDMVAIRRPDRPGEPCVVTINCPDKTGLGCEFCRIIFFFGLNIVRGGSVSVTVPLLEEKFRTLGFLLLGVIAGFGHFSQFLLGWTFFVVILSCLGLFGISIVVVVDLCTDGNWCFVVFWVVGREKIRWDLLKKRLLGACPAPFGIQSYCFRQVEQPSEPQLFLLKFSCYDRMGLLHDATQVLRELELTIKRVNVSTTPDGRVMDLFFITDTRELLHTIKRREDTCNQLKAALGPSLINCEIELASNEMTACFQTSATLLPAITDEIFQPELSEEPTKCSSAKQNSVSITMDNSLSPSHTLIQIFCRDQKGLFYDITRILKDHNIQLSYGRFYTSHRGNCEIDLFVMQVDRKKIMDLDKQEALSFRLKMEIFQPLRVSLINRGSNVELLVANPVESSGKGRPLVFFDVTLALKILNTRIFMATIGRHLICGREWEVYRFLLDDNCIYSSTRTAIVDAVTRKLMGWDC